MNRFLSILIGALMAGFPAAAQTVIVRSGEHEGFTRLVVPLPDKAAWSIGQSSRSVNLKIDLPSILFDVSQVFDRIPRSRLVNLSQENPGADLVFSLGCACSVSSYVDTPGFLIIDIKDNKRTSDLRRRIVDLPANQIPYRFSSQSDPENSISPGPEDLMLPVVVGQIPNVAPPSEAVPAPGNRRERPHGAINISEERLLAQIMRASDQGLVDLMEAPDLTAEMVAPVHSKEEGSPVPVSLSVTTVIDRDLDLVAHTLDQQRTNPACLKSSRLALYDWGGSQPFAAEIGHWRSQLFGEFDRVNPEALQNLARAYLHFGFGAESEQILGLTSQFDEDGRILTALARIIDKRPLGDDNPFSDQQQCNGDVTLWAVLSTKTVTDKVNDDAVLMAFSRLPPHLRSYLGPRISRIFADSGNGIMANSVLRLVARAGAEPGSGIELARAAAAELHGDSEAMVQELKTSLVSGTEHSPEALVKLIAKIFETRGTVSPDLPELAAAYALEYRNAKIGVDLRYTRAVALALAGQFLEAFATLPDIAERDGSAARQSALIPLLALLAERSDDVTFLRFALNAPLDDTNPAPVEASDQMARRLLDLGFPEQAARLISTPGENPTSEQRRRMRAEIALARRLPHRALVELMGVTGTEASRLRAAAMWLEGDFRQAGEMLIVAEDFDEAARGFWLAEEWEAVPEQADAHYSQVVAKSVQLRDSGSEVAPLTPLAEARALMENSSTVRGEIADLLQTVFVEPTVNQ